MSARSEFRSPLGILIEQIKSMISGHGFLGFKHMSRNVNSAAHKLTKFASSPQSLVWINNGFNSWLQEVVFIEL